MGGPAPGMLKGYYVRPWAGVGLLDSRPQRAVAGPRHHRLHLRNHRPFRRPPSFTVKSRGLEFIRPDITGPTLGPADAALGPLPERLYRQRRRWRGLPGKRAWVKVGPPLSCNGPSSGSVLLRSPVPESSQLPSLSRLCPREVIFPNFVTVPKNSPPPEELSATMVLIRVTVPKLKIPPPGKAAVLLLMVLLMTVSLLALEGLLMPPPFPLLAVLPLTVLLAIVRGPVFWMPPPLNPDELSLMVLLARVSVPKLRMPPPDSSLLPCRTITPEIAYVAAGYAEKPWRWASAG